MIGYASDVTTARNIAGLRAGGWRILYAAPRIDRLERWTPDFAYAIDNGAWTTHTRGCPFDFGAFVDAVEAHGGSADWVVAPDVVGGGPASLELSRGWVKWLKARCQRVLLAVQDGIPCTPATVAGFDGVAIGGLDPWKFAQLGHHCAAYKPCTPSCGTSRAWRDVCGPDRWLHVLRCNSQRRIRWCAMAGADSFDGSGPAKYDKHRQVLQRQLDSVNDVPPLLRAIEEGT